MHALLHTGKQAGTRAASWVRATVPTKKHRCGDAQLLAWCMLHGLQHLHQMQTTKPICPAGAQHSDVAVQDKELDSHVDGCSSDSSHDMHFAMHSHTVYTRDASYLEQL